jgi:adenosylmethionine-8-amino-7-oxononanoate aminotransferase
VNMVAHAEVARSAVLNRNPLLRLPTIANANEFYLIEENGTRYLDGISGAYAAIFGYSNAALAEEMSRVASTLPYIHNARFSNIHAEELALLLRTVFGHEYCTYYSVSGADGVEAAIRICQAYQLARGLPRRNKIAALSLSYHGSTLGALAATGHRPARRDYELLLREVVRIAAPVDVDGPTGHTSAKCIADIAELLNGPLGQNIAGCIVEPVLGNAAGSVPLPMTYLAELARLCRAHDVVLIADEVTTGLGRTGPALAASQAGIRPDIVVLGKALTAGYFPLSAVLVAPDVAAGLTGDTNLLGHTHAAHPIGAAVAVAVIQRLMSPHALEAKRRVEVHLAQEMAALREQPAVVSVRGRGLLYSVAFDSSFFQSRYGKRASEIVYKSCLDNGLLVMPGIALGNDDIVVSDHITIAPAFNMWPNDIASLGQKIKGVLKRL